MPKMRSISYLVVVLFLFIGASCVRQQSRPTLSTLDAIDAPFPRELRDSGGDVLRIAAPPRRIVSQTLATDEILLAICPPERLIALSSLALDEHYSNIAEQARPLALPAVKDAEQIITLKPDLIFVSTYSRADTVELLRATHAPVFRFANFDRIADIETNIRTLGRATGEDARAAALAAQMERDLSAIKARVPADAARARVLSFSPSGYTAGANTLFDDALEQIGAVNVAAEHGLQGFPQISAEQIAVWQPDYIVTGAARDKIDETRARLLANPIIAASKAGRAGRIIIIDDRYFLAVSQYVVLLVRELANNLYEK